MIARLLALALASGLAIVAPAASAVQRDGRLLELVGGYHLFSPNGDGRKDQLPVRFRLDEPAEVRFIVLERDREQAPKVRTERLTLPAGRHTWRWDGRDDLGRPVPDGSYRIRLRATAERDPARTGKAFHGAGVDRRLDHSRVWISRDAIYPSTPEFEDRIWIRSTTGGISTDLEIRDADGNAVRRLGIHGWGSWTARDDSGELVPPGEYDARFMISDRYGNQRTTHRTFTVSDDSLVSEVWSTTVRAADAELAWPDGYCPPTPSERFEGGVTVAVTDGCARCLFRPDLEPSFVLDPSTSWRVSVTGGPTTPGEPDAALISLRDGYSSSDVTTVPGDGTTTTPWGQVSRSEWALPQGWVFWLVIGDPDTSYDVAEFTVEVRHWVAPEDARRP